MHSSNRSLGPGVPSIECDEVHLQSGTQEQNDRTGRLEEGTMVSGPEDREAGEPRVDGSGEGEESSQGEPIEELRHSPDSGALCESSEEIDTPGAVEVERKVTEEIGPLPIYLLGWVDMLRRQWSFGHGKGCCCRVCMECRKWLRGYLDKV